MHKLCRVVAYDEDGLYLDTICAGCDLWRLGCNEHCRLQLPFVCLGEEKKSKKSNDCLWEEQVVKNEGNVRQKKTGDRYKQTKQNSGVTCRSVGEYRFPAHYRILSVCMLVFISWSSVFSHTCTHCHTYMCFPTPVHTVTHTSVCPQYIHRALFYVCDPHLWILSDIHVFSHTTYIEHYSVSVALTCTYCNTSAVLPSGPGLQSSITEFVLWRSLLGLKEIWTWY